MVPTHILVAAMTAFADPAPTPSLPPPDGPMLVINGEQMKFVHPVATNPYMPASAPAAHHTDQPKKSGSGGRGGSGGGSGSSGSSGTSGSSSSQSQAALAAAIAAAQQQAAQQQSGNGTSGQTGSSGRTGSQPTGDQSNPTVLPNPTDQTTAAMMPTSDLFAQSSSSTPSSSAGMGAVAPDAFDPSANSPVSTPEPGTIFLFVVGASVGGGAAVKKWLRRKK